MIGSTAVPFGMDPKEFAEMINSTPGLAEKLLQQQAEKVNTMRQSYRRMLGPGMSDQQFEATLNDPYFQGKMTGRQMKADAEKQKRRMQGMREGRSGF